MRCQLRVTLVTTTFVLTILSASVLSAAPIPWEQVDVTLHSEQSQSMMLVSGELPSDVELPAEAELAVPAGLELQWIGEILGGPSSEDPELSYAKTSTGGMDVYRFALTKSRTAQIEVPIAAGLVFDGTSYDSSLGWTSTQDIPEVRLNVRVPQAARIIKPTDGAALMPGDSGYSFYSKTFSDVKAGQQLVLTVGYSLPVITANSGSSSGSSVVIPVLLALATIVAAAAFVLAVRRKLAGAAKEGDVFDEVDEDEAAFAAPAGAAGDEGPRQDSETSAPVRPAGSTKRNLVTGGIIVVLVLAAVVVARQTTSPQLSGDTISQTFSAGEPCATATIALKPVGDADPRATAEAVFAAIKPLPGLNTATYNRKTSSVEVGFCESQTSEAALREALSPTGLLVQ